MRPRILIFNTLVSGILLRVWLTIKFSDPELSSLATKPQETKETIKIPKKKSWSFHKSEEGKKRGDGEVADISF